MRAIRPLVFRLLLCAFGVALTVLLLEVGLRVGCAVEYRRSGGTLATALLRGRSPFQDDQDIELGDMIQASRHADIVYEFKPGLRCHFRSKPVAINAGGMRGPECQTGKPAGVFRIVGLGDSVMFGWGCAQDDEYMSVLARVLNALPGPHPVYETLNFAVPGYNTAIEAAVFEHKALAFSPDLVVIHFVNNDFGVPLFMLKPVTGTDWHKSYAREFIAARLGRAYRNYEDEQLVFNEFRNVSEEDAANIMAEYRWMCGEAGYERAAERLGRLARERGIPVIVLLGSLGDDQRAIVTGCARQWGFQVLDIAPYTPRAMAANGVPDTPENWVQVGQVSGCDAHPTAYAHTIYAEGLLETMQTLKLAPPGTSPLLDTLRKQALARRWPAWAEGE